MRTVLVLLLCVLAAVLGAGGAWLWSQHHPGFLEEEALAQRVREVARLETLEVSLYKKVSFTPEPQASDSLWRNVLSWARHSVRNPHGRALLFADATLSVDLSRLGRDGLRVSGTRVEVVLPPVVARVSLKPGETEVLDSNLDTEETAQLFELAREAFQREVESDEALKARARASAERTLRALFLGLGFSEVRFVDRLPALTPG
jgi:hypothetical protein